MRKAPVHYLRKNDTLWTPPAVICFDTETRRDLEGDQEVHVMRLWCATLTDRRAQGKITPGVTRASGTQGDELAHQVHAWTTGRRTVWMYAHNLHFDLCVSDLVNNLTELGWHVTDFAVDGAVPFVRMAKGERHLVISDSWSWLPVPLKRISGLVDIAKPALPDGDASDEAWFARCQADTDILTSAMLTLMDWWDDSDLGRWSITGGSSGWNVMRHIPAHRRILIDPDPERVKDDRLAIYGGRRGMWRTGDLPPSRYCELDLERAYTTVCRDFPLPLERLAHFDGLPLTHSWLKCERYGVIARVLIETDTPRWPVRDGRRVWYPTGQFWTTLAGPDISEALRLGCLREVGAGWVHRLGYALRPWAMWCLSAQSDTSGETPEVAKITLKHWGRTVVGKWAQHGFTRIELGAAPTTGWGFLEGWNHNSGAKASIVDFGGVRWQVSASAESDNTYPAVLAFVESFVRVALGRVIAALGVGSLVSCDTDGVLTEAVPGHRRQAAIAAARPFNLREKAWYRQVKAIGPQHAVIDGHRRFAGIPASAVENPDGKLSAVLWPKLAWQMRNGRAGAYVRPGQDYLIGGTYAPGWVLTSGHVAAVEMTAGPDGANHLTPWPATSHARSGARLGPCQNPALGRYLRGEHQTRDRPDHLARAASGAADRDRAMARPRQRVSRMRAGQR